MSNESLSDRQIKALEVLGKHGGKYPAAFVGRHLNPAAKMAHGAGASVLRSLETRGLAERHLSNSWSTGVDVWSSTPKGRARLAAIRKIERS